jgi:hypothetical protein
MKLRYSINTAGVSLAVFPSKKTTVLTEGAEGDAEDEEGDGVRNTGAAEEVARGDSQNQRHPNEEHRVIRLTHLSLSLSSFRREVDLLSPCVGEKRRREVVEDDADSC